MHLQNFTKGLITVFLIITVLLSNVISINMYNSNSFNFINSITSVLTNFLLFVDNFINTLTFNLISEEQILFKTSNTSDLFFSTSYPSQKSDSTILHIVSTTTTLDNQQSWFDELKPQQTKLLISHIWNMTFFFFIFYLMTIFSVTTYSIPQVSNFTNTVLAKNITNYLHLTTDSLYKFFLTPLILILTINLVWTSQVVYLWFGQMTLSTLQHSLSFLCVLVFTVMVYVYFTTLVINSKEVFEFIIVLFNTFVWIFFLFYANNIFTIIFFIEILTSLVFLVLITSSFSSSYNYDVTHYSKTLYFQPLIPTNILNSLIFLFWTSLVASLLLFMFLMFFYMSIFTFEFSLIDVITTYVVSVHTFNQLIIVFMTAFLLLIIIFLKSGLVPLFIWKPTVFKGMTLHSIFFYICFYYYFLLLFFIYIILIDLSDMLFYNQITLVTVIIIGTLMLFTVLIEAYYFKSFLAMSSILNTLLIFLGVSSVSNSNFFFTL